MTRFPSASLALALLALLPAGCIGVPHPPARAVPGAKADWIEGHTAGEPAAKWWQALHDPALDALVAAALTANPDIATAEAHLTAARAQRQAAAGAELPVVGVSASGTRSGQSLNGVIPIGRLPGVSRDNTIFQAGFDASWEVDVWGGARSASAAASARADEAAANLAGARLAVAGEVVRDYVDLAHAAARRASLARELDAARALLTLAERRQSAGESAVDTVLSARQRMAATEAALASLDAVTRALALALAPLTGQAPEATQAIADHPPLPPAVPIAVPVGLRSEVLTRRPDVRAASADLAAYVADTGVARAALYPHLTLGFSAGQQATSRASLLSPGSTLFGFGPTLSWPLFAGGRARAALAGSRAAAQAAAKRYDKAVLAALADSETAATRYAHAQAAAARQQDAATAARAALVLSERRVAAGEDSAVDLAQQRIAAAQADETALAAASDLADAWVALNKALGGGW